MKVRRTETNHSSQSLCLKKSLPTSLMTFSGVMSSRFTPDPVEHVMGGWFKTLFHLFIYLLDIVLKCPQSDWRFTEVSFEYNFCYFYQFGHFRLRI